jgi:glycogen phosphorylase
MTDFPPPPRTLPEPLRDLTELALDLHWMWSHGGDALWRQLDPDLWERTGNPCLILQLVPGVRLESLASDSAFLEQVEAQVLERRRLMQSPSWFAGAHGTEPSPCRIAYFSMEFGLHESLPIYAGGLGILAGDHLKTASDLGVPIVGVGILWQQGYFRQAVDEAGNQQEFYPHNDPANLPIQPLLTHAGDPLEVMLELPGRLLRLRGWQAVVGRNPLYLLDANHPLNAPADRGITATLYSSDPETRLLQELVLGIGGWRLLQALGCEIDVCHLNEGHAAFVVIERARTFMQRHGLSFREALWATRAGNVFTTHTSVAAGFDSFGQPLIGKYTAYFDAYVRRLGITWPELLALGRRNADDPNEPFSMAYLALRGCARINGVSALHGEVSRRLFANLFPRWPLGEIPVAHVTNGVHVPSWDSVEADELWTVAAGKDRWRGDLTNLGEAIAQRPDEELWTLRNRARAALVRRARQRLHRQLAQWGATGESLEVADRVLDPTALTLGFARRFTAYKRPNLLLSDRPRLHRLLTDAARPVQLLIAGKAHPADGEGKWLLAEWARFAAEVEVRHRVVFLEDYDMALARELIEGVDVWLNTPLRPWEACGTSGMKVLVNGGLNLSELDGWWAEAYSPGSGWALHETHQLGEMGPGGSAADQLYRLLETEVAPLFYRRDAAGLPREWLQRVRTSMAELAPRFSSNRMLRQYVNELYAPAADDLRDRSASGARVARELAAWESRVLAHWHDVQFGDCVAEEQGGVIRVRVEVFLGGLTPDDVRVELFAEPVHGSGPLRERLDVAAHPSETGGGFHFATTIRTDRPHRHLTPRVLADHAGAHLPLELAVISWQR